MPTQEKNQSLPGLTPKVAIGNIGTSVPTDFQQLVSEVPSSTKTSVTPERVKLTRKAAAKIIKRSNVLASHWLNLPIVDGVTMVASIYKALNDMGNNYERTHQDAFFEAYPGMLLLRSDEEILISTSWLRRNRKVLCKRAAHYFYHYSNAVMHMNGAMANLMSASRLTGNTLFNVIGYETRWSKINSNSTMFERFCVPIGIQQYIFSNMGFGVGKTSYGADIVSLPMFVTDIFGNRGCHAMPLETILSTKGGDGTEYSEMDLLDAVKTDAKDADALIQHMYATMYEYGPDNEDIDTPRMPHLENGAESVMINEDGSFAAHLNLDAFHSLALNKDYSDQISSSMWVSYKFWEKYLISNFPEMMDPNSDFYEFGMNVLNLYEKSSRREELLNIVRSLQNLDMVDMLKHMVYKGNNKVSTATIVRWAPLYKGTDGGSRSDDWLEYNFERYHVDSDNIGVMLKEAKEWPALAPTTFTDCSSSDSSSEYDPSEPYIPWVVNAAPSSGKEITSKADLAMDDKSNSVVAPTGKFATILDQACVRSLDPETTSLTFMGLSSEEAKSFTESNNGITFEEDPTTVRAFSVPLIDNTDIYQCGFNLIISADSVNQSEAEKYYTDKAMFPGVELPVPLESDSKPKISAINISKTSQPEWVRCHTADARYMNVVKYAFIFLGAGIFDHPLLNSAVLTAGNPCYRLKLGNDDLISNHIKQVVAQSRLEDTARDNSWAAFFAANDFNTSPLKGETGYGNEDLIKQMFKTGNSPDREYLQFIFAPEYGPVRPMVSNFGIDNFMPYSIFKDTISSETNSDIKPCITQNAAPEGAGSGGTTFQRQMLADTITTPDTMYIPNLVCLRYNPARISENGNISMAASQAFKELRFAGTTKYALSLLAVVNVQYTGIEDTKPFWTSDKLAKALRFSSELQSIATTGSMPENNVIAPPRTIRNQVKSGSRNFSSYKAKPTGFKSQGKIAAERLGVKSNCDKRSKKSGNGKKSSYSESGIAGLDNSLSREGVSSGGNGTNMMDPTPSAMDKDFSKRKVRDRADPVSMQM